MKLLGIVVLLSFPSCELFLILLFMKGKACHGNTSLQITWRINKLEDLKVLRRSPDLLNNFKTGQGQLQLLMKHILFYNILGLQPF